MLDRTFSVAAFFIIIIAIITIILSSSSRSVTVLHQEAIYFSLQERVAGSTKTE